MNLAALIPYLHNFRRSGTTGCWTAANCPACGERSATNGNRLRIWPDTRDGRGSWSCRKCGAYGSGADLLMFFQPGLSYRQAAALLSVSVPDVKATSTSTKKGGGSWWNRLQRERALKKRLATAVAMAPALEAEMKAAMARAVHVHRCTEASEPRPLPPSAWSDTVGAVFRDARGVLLTAPMAATYLADRGLTPEAAYAAGSFAWLEHDLWLDNATCGLESTSYRGQRWLLPAGLMVVAWTHRHDGEQAVVGACVHCLDRERWDKRRSAAGVAARAAVLQPACGCSDLVLIMESAVDALLAWEASGRTALCIGVGGTWMPDDLADAAICAAVDVGAPVVLVPDADDAGRRAADGWQRRWPSAIRVEAEGGKDLSDADRAARAGVPGALRASAWMAMVRARLHRSAPAGTTTSSAEVERLLSPDNSVNPSS